MAERLTPQQQMAVDDRGGKLLVSAAAGSGKTKVLVDRLLKYLCDPADPANIDEFLIITYTKAAAAELRGKIAAKLSEHIANDPSNRHLQRQLQRLYLTKISTVHAFCADILREYAYKLDITADFRVADENECIQLRSRAMEQILESAYDAIGTDADFQAFVDTQGLGRSDALVPEIVLQVYDSAMCHTDPKAWRDGCIAATEDLDGTDPLQTPWGSYLAQDLFACLDMQIAAMTAAADAVAAVPGLEKPAALLRDTVYQLEALRDSRTWDEILQRRNIDYGRLVFPKKADDPAVSGPAKAVRAACKEILDKKLRVFSDSGEQVMADLAQSAASARGLMDLVDRFAQYYSRMKRQRRVLDFSDLEHKTLDLLLGRSRATPTAAAREIGARYREIMVDEYQDSNGVQDAIFSSLTQQRQNLFMVGDVKQSIYQFRLADPGIFLEKYNTYCDASVAQPGQGRRVLLSSNFRSGGGVVDAVNHVFAACMSRQVGGLEYTQDEALREGVAHIPLDEPEVQLHAICVQEDTYAEEAAFVAQQICSLTDGTHHVRNGDTLRPIVAEDIVILLRSPGSMAMAFVEALAQRGIRCTSGAGQDLLLTPEIGTLRSLLQVISNPRQDIPLLAVLASPVFAFTADELAGLRQKDRRCSIYEAVLSSDTEKCKQFLAILERLRKAAAMGTLPELFERIYNLTRLDAIYAAMPDGQTSAANLQAFYQLAVDYGSMGGEDLDRFLSHLETLEGRGLVAASDESAAGCVTVMSIHKSKGLEFPVVFLCGLSHRFNQESLRQQVLCHKEMGLGLSCVDRKNRVRYPTLSKAAISAKMMADSISEEMRVLYVALTRPRDRLIMTYASQSLEKDVAELAGRMDMSGKALMTADVSCPGQWILYAALRRTEAGELFAMGGKPAVTESAGAPWQIRVWEGSYCDTPPVKMQAEESDVLRETAVETLRKRLGFRYGHTAATVTPSKQTATQRKGRTKDQEAAEQASVPKHEARQWRRPGFSAAPTGGAAYGSAMHAVLQYLRYESCCDTAAVKAEVDRLALERYVTPEQAQMVDCEQIAAFFATELGQKLRSGGEVLREFKFSILDDATNYGSGLEGERVLLQGVVDCALLEEDGITVVDFKTDHVTPATLETVTARYALQVQTYADALGRIFQRPVKAKALYYFHVGRFCWL